MELKETGTRSPEKIVKDAFDETKKRVRELGWSGSAVVKEGGTLRHLIDPPVSRMGTYIPDYPNRLLGFFSNSGFDLSAETITLINLALAWNIAQRDFKGSPSVFSGNLTAELEANPHFQLALILTKQGKNGIAWTDILATERVKVLNAKLNNGAIGAPNPSYPSFSVEEIKEGCPNLDPKIFQSRQFISPREILQLINSK
jgi:hypothetical protein